MEVEILGKSVHLIGNQEDSYFTAAQHVVNGAADIVRLANTLPEESVIFDIGANIGIISIILSIVRPHAKIISFEPSPNIIEHLKYNVLQFPNIEVVQAAISDRAGILRFNASSEAAASHVVGDGHLLQSTETVEVQAFTLDSFASKRALLPNMIKIDVEGHEPEVIAGATQTIEAARPEIAMEFNSWTLVALGGHNPATFAQSIWENFEVDGYPRALEFLHDNLVSRSCLTDIVMRLKPDSKVPSLADMSVSKMARRILAQDSN